MRLNSPLPSAADTKTMKYVAKLDMKHKPMENGKGETIGLREAMLQRHSRLEWIAPRQDYPETEQHHGKEISNES